MTVETETAPILDTPMPTLADVAREMLQETAAVIERFGWVQESMGNVRQGFCLLGAIDHVFWSWRTCESDEVYNRCTDMLRSQTTQGIIAWNDSAGRTKDDVLKLIEAAIERNDTLRELQADDSLTS